MSVVKYEGRLHSYNNVDRKVSIMERHRIKLVTGDTVLSRGKKENYMTIL